MAKIEKALLGWGLMTAGFYFVVLSIIGIVSMSILASVFGSFTQYAPFFVLFILGGIVTFIYGAKMYIENIEPIGKLLLGLLGVATILFAFLVAVAGLATVELGVGIVILFMDLVVLAMGLAFLRMGWKISVFRPLDSLIDSFGKLVGLK